MKFLKEKDYVKETAEEMIKMNKVWNRKQLGAFESSTICFLINASKIADNNGSVTTRDDIERFRKIVEMYK